MAVRYYFDAPDKKTVSAQSKVTFLNSGVSESFYPTSALYFQADATSDSLIGAAMSSLNSALVDAPNQTGENIIITSKSVYEGVVS